MDVACLIPARYNSGRFPGKLLAKARKKTVLQRTIESALGYFEPAQLFVATDDERIASHVEELEIQVIWTSPTCPNGTERIAEAVEKSPSLSRAEIILNLQGDHPCMRPETLRAAVEALQSNSAAAMSTVATPISSLADFLSPHIVKVVVDGCGAALYFSRSPIPYSRGILPKNALHHIGLYCFRRRFLLEYPRISATPLQLAEDLEQLKLLEKGWRIQVAIVQETAIGVDVPEDLIKLEEYLSKL